MNNDQIRISLHDVQVSGPIGGPVDLDAVERAVSDALDRAAIEDGTDDVRRQVARAVRMRLQR